MADPKLTTKATGSRRLRWVLAAAGLAVVASAIALTWESVMTASVNLPVPEPADEFNASRAMQYLETICALGPRVSDSRAMRRQQQLLEEYFEKLGARVVRQSFTARQPSQGRFRCTNLIVNWDKQAKRRVLIGAHYDTRPIADKEPIFRNRGQGQFLGANDGASGVALLMELGRLMPGLDLKVGVDFVFFDAEEYIFDARRDRYFFGSEHFVREYVRSKPNYRYEAVVVVDMIGDRDLQIHPDQRSSARAGALVKEVWDVARQLGATEFRDDVKYDILDDHLAFQEANIPAIVLIDFDYPHWHRLADTPDKCSGESLKVVAQVLVEWMKKQR